MSKLVNQPIELKFRGSFPAAFHFGREFKIKYILNHWRKGASGGWMNRSSSSMKCSPTNAAVSCIFYPNWSSGFSTA